MDDKYNQTGPERAESQIDPLQAQLQQQMEQQLQRERRRRFIRLGAGSVPVGLTLTSRPVMAWHCYTTSAWGSQRADGVAVGTSVYNRLEKNIGTTRLNNDECWYITNWVNNTGRSGGPSRYQQKPWRYIGSVTPGRPEGMKNSDWGKKLTVAAVFQGGLQGVDSTALCFDVIKNGVSTIAQYVLIAGLNRKYAETSHQEVMNKCLRPNQFTGPDQLDAMAQYGPSLSYKPPGRTVAWDLEDIKKYLKDSWMAV